MRDWEQLLQDIRATMLEFPQHYMMPGYNKKTPGVLNSIGASAIEEALHQFDASGTRIQELESEVRSHLENAERGVEVVRSQKAQIEVLHKENQTLKDTLEAWQAVVRVAREKDSTLPDPEAVPC